MHIRAITIIMENFKGSPSDAQDEPYIPGFRCTHEMYGEKAKLRILSDLQGQKI